MKLRTICACMSTALFISFPASSVFADVSPVTTRALLNGTDVINWEGQGDGNVAPDPEYFSYLIDANFGTDPNLNLPNVMSDNGMMIAVSQKAQYYSAITREPSPYFPTYFLPTGEYLLSTYITAPSNSINPFTFTFSDANGPEICGFGTQSATAELGAFTAQLEAFDGTGSMGTVQVEGSDADSPAKFIGISSTTPMTSVKFSIVSSGSGSGSFLASYVINQITLTACPDAPEIPVMTCEGFGAPMANHPVKAKKNRAFPLKIELFDGDGFEQTDVELVAAPVVTVMFASSEGEDAVDINEDALSSGKGSDGNRFDYTDDGIWQFNLKSKGYASGTYYVTVDSGDPTEYVIEEPSCVTSFTIK